MEEAEAIRNEQEQQKMTELEHKTSLNNHVGQNGVINLNNNTLKSPPPTAKIHVHSDDDD
jgi:hypothetical protein